jgi:lysine 2,3-aminomutase
VNNSTVGPTSRYASTAVPLPTADIFQDEWLLGTGAIDIATDDDLKALWAANEEIRTILRESEYLEDARENLFEYLNLCEKEVFSPDNELHPLEKANIRECVRVFRSIIGPINEKRTQFSALGVLWKLANEEYHHLEYTVSRGFILEFEHLFRGVTGNSRIYSRDEPAARHIPDFLRRHGRAAAQLRSRLLDESAAAVDAALRRHPSGLDARVRARRAENRDRILEYFGGQESDWRDYHWHLRHVIRDEHTLGNLIELKDEEREAVRLARQHRIPFGITPYYLSLMDYNASRKWDHAIRSQVIPPLHYVLVMKQQRENRNRIMDFMGEHDTSPVDLVTRRYPKIAILKPYDTCAQICVYCQRNWEIEGVLSPRALATEDQLQRAVEWFREHPAINDCLITGGDPVVMSDRQLDRLLGRLAEIEHLTRIRLGTRTPVVLPYRFTGQLLAILEKYHQPGRREMCVVTHFEHPYEVTPETQEAITNIRRLGIACYNQEVYTVENSRRFETAALREALRLIGVDPYYNFIAKGKEETRDYRVPIARILQERKEEARLFPGISRTDEPIFNVPRLGKNHLRAWQDHLVVMIMPDGRRVYEFHPWEKNLAPIPPYYHYDVPIYNYLQELERRGENMADYETIWYYY